MTFYLDDRKLTRYGITMREFLALRVLLPLSTKILRRHGLLGARTNLRTGLAVKTSPSCDHEGCERPVRPGASPAHFSRCTLHEIASYNEDELREWGEENAADMVRLARTQLATESGGA